MEVIISNKYKLGKTLGEGSFGKIFEGININTNEKIAIKIEKKNSNSEKSLLRHEGNIYNRCKEIKGIPNIKSFGVEGNYVYMVMERLGSSIDELREKCGGKLNLRTVLTLAIQLISRLENLHNIGIIHRDLKPDNLLVGLGSNRRIIYLIDFGLAKYYIDSSGKHKAIIRDKNLTGTIRYASLNVQDGIEASRRDDLESLGYICIYCLKGGLPWQTISHTSADTKEKKYDSIKTMKREIELINLCSNIPLEFMIYLNYCRILKYDETPNYNYLKNLFFNLYKLNGFNSNDEFEWF